VEYIQALKSIGFYQSPNIGSLADAMAGFQKEIGPIKYNKDVKIPLKGGQFKQYSYADLQSIYAEIKNIAPKFGLSFTQQIITIENQPHILTMIMHNTGEYQMSAQMVSFGDLKDYDGNPRGPTIQERGGAYTYYKRYAIVGAFGIAAEDDDDASEASGKHDHVIQQRKPAMPPIPPPPLPMEKSINVGLDEQRSLFELARKQGYSDQEIKDAIFNMVGVKSSKEIPKVKLEMLMVFFRNNKKGN
jgi:hypothetical protein